MTLTIILLLVNIILATIFIIKSDDKPITAAIAIMISVVTIPLCFLPVYLQGFHYETGRGEHVGYVTATEKTGIFFKTGRAYFKTDAQSSQEDTYCVIDDAVFTRLAEDAQKKERITIKYFSYLAAGIANCEAEGAIIYDIQ